MTDEQRKSYIAALLQERRGYEQKGQTARLEAVDAELKRLGHGAQKPSKRAEKRG